MHRFAPNRPDHIGHIWSSQLRKSQLRNHHTINHHLHQYACGVGAHKRGSAIHSDSMVSRMPSNRRLSG